MIKICGSCREEKEADEFYRDALMGDGRSKTCKVCKNLKTEQWRIENREKYNASMRKYNSKHYERLRIMRYNLVPEDHAELLKIQDGKCAICKKRPKTLRPLNIDHDHQTDKVRGLLCHGCNRAMALLDNPELLAAAIAYKAKYA